MDALAKLGVDVSRIKLSDRAHVVTARHAQADRDAEAARGANALGTTGRGIGPAYVEKAARTGTTFGMLLAQGKLDARVAAHLVDGAAYMQHALASGKKVLAEGAQGTLLDVGYGTYPFVTSSQTLAGAACTGLGVGPRAIDRVLGVIKAYATRVGGGPFPSELDGGEGERLRETGAEFGTVTGRPRRCGWFDAVAARYASQLNGLSAAAITKLDVLDGFERIGIVTAYRVGNELAEFSAAGDPGLKVEVEYVDGWRTDLSGTRRMADLPREARTYVERIEDAVGAAIECVSVGPERSQLAV